MEVLWYVLGIIQKLVLEFRSSPIQVLVSALSNVCNKYLFAFMFLGFNLQICERSLTSNTGGPVGPPATSSVRAKMLPSGFLIRPCEGGGSIIHIVDHIDLDVSKFNWSNIEHYFYLDFFFLSKHLGAQACSVPEVLRPLYESSKILAQKLTMAVRNLLCYCLDNWIFFEVILL